MCFRAYRQPTEKIVSDMLNRQRKSRLISHAVVGLCQCLSSAVMSMSVPTTSVPSPPRSARPLAARKQQNDPAWFSINTTSVTSASAKRQAVERVEGEPQPRNKRKRVEPTLQTTSQLGHRVDKLQERQNGESPVVSFVLLYCHQGAIQPNHCDLSTTRGTCWSV